MEFHLIFYYNLEFCIYSPYDCTPRYEQQHCTVRALHFIISATPIQLLNLILDKT